MFVTPPWLHPTAEEPVGLFALDGCTGTLDISHGSGNGSIATIEGTTPVNGPAGEFHGALSFANGGSISISTTSDMDTRYSLTILLHVRLDASGTILSYPEGNIRLAFDGTRLIFTVGARNGTDEIDVSADVTTQEWHYVGLVADYNDNAAHVFLDSNLAASNYFAHFYNELATQGEIVVGTDGFNGELSCLQFYNRALMEEEYLGLSDCPSGVGMGAEGKGSTALEP